MSLQECKDQIAKRHGFDNFLECYTMGLETSVKELLKYSDEASELYAQQYIDEIDLLRDVDLLNKARIKLESEILKLRYFPAWLLGKEKGDIEFKRFEKEYVLNIRYSSELPAE